MWKEEYLNQAQTEQSASALSIPSTIRECHARSENSTNTLQRGRAGSNRSEPTRPKYGRPVGCSIEAQLQDGGSNEERLQISANKSPITQTYGEHTQWFLFDH